MTTFAVVNGNDRSVAGQGRTELHLIIYNIEWNNI